MATIFAKNSNQHKNIRKNISEFESTYYDQLKRGYPKLFNEFKCESNFINKHISKISQSNYQQQSNQLIIAKKH